MAEEKKSLLYKLKPVTDRLPAVENVVVRMLYQWENS